MAFRFLSLDDCSDSFLADVSRIIFSGNRKKKGKLHNKYLNDLYYLAKIREVVIIFLLMKLK